MAMASGGGGGGGGTRFLFGPECEFRGWLEGEQRSRGSALAHIGECIGCCVVGLGESAECCVPGGYPSPQGGDGFMLLEKMSTR
jgi:hypothetical protein